MSISCLNCGFAFEGEDYKKPCPRCGSRNRSVTVTDQAKGHDMLKLRKKGDTSRKHKHKPYEERTVGEKVGKDGKPVSIERIIDRERDVYTEIVKDEQGKAIVEKHEKLSEHG